MCEQCVINPYYWYDILPGWTLVRARRESTDTMEVGDFGLVRMNDPSMVWKSTPKEPLFWSDSAEERDNLFDTTDLPEGYWQRVPDDFMEGFLSLSLMEAYQLVDAAFEKGYDKEFDGGRIEDWLWDYFGHVIHTVKPTVEEDGLPALDANTPHDYNYRWDM